MAVQTQITDWIMAAADDLDLRIVNLGWTERWAPGIQAIAATITLGDCAFTGHGADEDLDTAVVKAVVEALERATKAESALPTTSGLAGHVNADQAARNALREFIERDAFFCHYLTGTPFRQLGDMTQLPTAAIDWQRLQGISRTEGVELQFASLTVPDGFHGVVCAAFGADAARPFGVILGLGCEQSTAQAAQKAALECLGNVAAQLDGRLGPALSADSFKSLSKPWVFDHLHLGLDEESASVMRRLFKPADDYGRALHIEGVNIETMPSLRTTKDAPLHFARVTVRHGQNAYFGKQSPEVLNLNRLGCFVGKTLAISDLEPHPHFLA